MFLGDIGNYFHWNCNDFTYLFCVHTWCIELVLFLFFFQAFYHLSINEYFFRWVSIIIGNRGISEAFFLFVFTQQDFLKKLSKHPWIYSVAQLKRTRNCTQWILYFLPRAPKQKIITDRFPVMTKSILTGVQSLSQNICSFHLLNEPFFYSPPRSPFRPFSRPTLWTSNSFRAHGIYFRQMIYRILV